MGTTYNTSIVRDSLLLYLDAANKKSYPGSTAYWTDLSGNSKTVTFYSPSTSTYSDSTPTAPTYSANNMGLFSFNGTNNWGKFTAITSTTNFSVSFWIKFTTSAQKGLLSHCSGGPVGEVYGINSGKLEYRYYYGSWLSVPGTITINDDTWKNVVFTRSGTNMFMYVNGVQDSNPTLSATKTSPLNCIGSQWGPCNSDSYGPGTDSYPVFPGSIGSIMVHTKQLSPADVIQNFEALRRRYNV